MVITEVELLEQDFIERLVKDTDEYYKISDVARKHQMRNLNERKGLVDIVPVGNTNNKEK